MTKKAQEHMSDASLDAVVEEMKTILGHSEEGRQALAMTAQHEAVEERLKEKKSKEETLPQNANDLLLQEMSNAARQGLHDKSNLFKKLYFDLGGLEQYKELGVARQIEKGLIHGLIAMDSGTLVLGDPCYIESEKDILGQETSSMKVLSGAKKGNWVAESRYNPLADSFFGVGPQEIVLYHASVTLKEKDFKKAQGEGVSVDSGMVGIYDYQEFFEASKASRYYDACCATCRPPTDGGILGNTFVSSTGGDGSFRYAIATQGEEIVGVKITFARKKR